MPRMATFFYNKMSIISRSS